MGDDTYATYEIYWDDLTNECQEHLKDFLGGENGNYDIFPLAVITKSGAKNEDY